MHNKPPFEDVKRAVLLESDKLQPKQESEDAGERKLRHKRPLLERLNSLNSPLLLLRDLQLVYFIAENKKSNLKGSKLPAGVE